MDNLYIFIVVVLFILAISDLVVGVANDAVNFLNAAVGSKTATFKWIMAVAAVGVFVGAAFSGGMMEVARKGIFNPQHFYFSEIMVIFLAVMITDVILLDGFNTLGLPTSTTVSLVFELLGSAVAITIIKVNSDPNALQFYEYINTSKALGIISGILISVVVSFIAGAVIQYFARLTFTFNLTKTMRYYGSVFGGLAVASIVYFMLVKGAKGATFLSDEAIKNIENHAGMILFSGFLISTVLLQIFQWLFRVNPLKFVVLLGTFALAMAFAGNDLVNFVGVPLAGYESYKIFHATPGAEPSSLLMHALTGEIKTETYLLILSGIVMVITLYTSKKAKNVIKTSVDLSRQESGEERFQSTPLARAVVRLGINFSTIVDAVTPAPVKAFVAKRFDQTAYLERIGAMENPPAFDLIRASVTLVVSSILIAFATSMKLPLSTTYVTFMVAMGTSLSDKAWGRDSAVYRISGVFIIISGWFLTAMIAFTVAFIIANIIYYGGTIAIIAMVLLTTFLLYRTQKMVQNIEEIEVEKDRKTLSAVKSEKKIIEECVIEVNGLVDNIGRNYDQLIEGFINEDRKQLKTILSDTEAVGKNAKTMKRNAFSRLKQLEEKSVESGLFYIQVLDYLRETTHSLEYMVSPAYNHINNNHKPFLEEQKAELAEVSTFMRSFFSHCNRMIGEKDFSKLDQLLSERDFILEFLSKLSKQQLKRLKREKTSTKVSMLYMLLLQETRGMMHNMINLVKAERDFVDADLKLK